VTLVCIGAAGLADLPSVEPVAHPVGEMIRRAFV